MVKTMLEVVVSYLSPALTPVKMAWLLPYIQTLSCLPVSSVFQPGYVAAQLNPLGLPRTT